MKPGKPQHLLEETSCVHALQGGKGSWGFAQQSFNILQEFVLCQEDSVLGWFDTPPVSVCLV